MRDEFSFETLLPNELADALELIQQPLPTDPLSAVLTLLCGYSGALKIGSRIAADHQYSVPTNIFYCNVARSGVAKTSVKQKLIDEPASTIKAMYRKQHEGELEQWRERCGVKKRNEHPQKPRPVMIHAGGNYSPEAVDVQLELHENRGIGLLIMRDEFGGLLQSLANDAKHGRGTGEAQFLELYDGSGCTSLRVEKVRHYEQSHVSLYGNIQPDVLRRHINGDDSSGKWARIIFNQLPVMPLELRHEEPTDQEKSLYISAQTTLSTYAMKLHEQKPRVLELETEARKCLFDWYRMHNANALATSSSVESALLGKALAQVLRIAGLLHMVSSIGGNAAKEKVSPDQIHLAMKIVDTIIAEMRVFHHNPQDTRTLLMRRLHERSWRGGNPISVTWQDVKRLECTTTALRKMQATDFYAVAEELEERGLGVVDKDGTVTYKACRIMPI